MNFSIGWSYVQELVRVCQLWGKIKFDFVTNSSVTNTVCKFLLKSTQPEKFYDLVENNRMCARLRFVFLNVQKTGFQSQDTGFSALSTKGSDMLREDLS